MQFDFKRTVEKVNIYGTICDVTVLNASEQKSYEEEILACGDDMNKTFDVALGYLEKAGVKKEIAEQMEIGHLQELVEFALFGKKK